MYCGRLTKRMQIDVSGEFDNVYIYVSDALRWQHFQDGLDGEHPVKTISHSPLSCTAFSSMVSGLYPPQHGVTDFDQVLSADVVTLFDLFDGDCPCYMGVGPVVNSAENAVHYNDLDAFTERVETIEPPFFVFDRELVTHTPYGYDISGEHLEDDDRIFQDATEYWHDRRGDREQVLADYERGVERSVDRFHARMALLEERDLLEDTLVLFTADHGELLGEYGMYGHGPMLAPEVSYVPTVFYSDGVSADGSFMGHVDLLPTVASVIGGSVPDGLPGYDLTAGAPDDRLLYSGDPYDNNNVEEWAAWDAGGGHTFSDASWGTLLYDAAGKLTTRGSKTVAQRRSPLAVLANSLRRHGGRAFERPIHSREEAAAFCEEVRTATRSASATELDEETEQHLADLGYR